MPTAKPAANVVDAKRLSSLLWRLASRDPSQGLGEHPQAKPVPINRELQALLDWAWPAFSSRCGYRTWSWLNWRSLAYRKAGCHASVCTQAALRDLKSLYDSI